MRRGGSLHPRDYGSLLPLTRLPLSSQARGRCSIQILVTFKDLGFGKVQDLPRKKEHFWEKGERRQVLPWDPQSLRSCGKLTEPS